MNEVIRVWKSLSTHFNVRVLVAFAVASLVLGVLNNFRVYEEQRVGWWPTWTEEAVE